MARSNFVRLIMLLLRIKRLETAIYQDFLDVLLKLLFSKLDEHYEIFTSVPSYAKFKLNEENI